MSSCVFDSDVIAYAECLLDEFHVKENSVLLTVTGIFIISILYYAVVTSVIRKRKKENNLELTIDSNDKSSFIVAVLIKAAGKETPPDDCLLMIKCCLFGQKDIAKWSRTSPINLSKVGNGTFVAYFSVGYRSPGVIINSVSLRYSLDSKMF